MNKYLFEISVCLFLFIIVTGCVDKLGNSDVVDGQYTLTDKEIKTMIVTGEVPDTFIKQCWLKDGKASVLSGIGVEPLYVIYSITYQEDGTAIISNCYTLTAEELSEQQSSQRYRGDKGLLYQKVKLQH